MIAGSGVLVASFVIAGFEFITDSGTQWFGEQWFLREYRRADTQILRGQRLYNLLTDRPHLLRSVYPWLSEEELPTWWVNHYRLFIATGRILVEGQYP